MSYKGHYSVLKEESLSWLTQEGALESGVFADLTFGGGGHTLTLARRSDSYKVFATDQDPDALKNGFQRIDEEGLQNRVILLDMNFESFYEYCIEHGVKDLDGILIDLGVSSHHFDAPERGFSFRFDAPLDMRMDADNENVETAAELLSRLSEEEIADLLWKYGEERFSKQIARNICEVRQTSPIETTKQLEDVIFHSYPKKMRFGRIHPATKSFQALRIAVNRELEVLQKVLEDLPKILNLGGRMAIITFHSLEDRIVKRSYNYLAKEEKTVKILTKKPILPSKKELEENKRSRSAKLRVIQKV